MSSIKDGIWTIAGITIGGAIVYSLYSCYKEKGSIAPAKLAECFIEGSASTLFNVAADLGKELWNSALKPLGEGIGDKVLEPIGDFFKDDVGNFFKKDVGDFFKKDIGNGFKKAGKTLLKPGEEAAKSIKKVFSKDNMKKGFKKIFHF